MSSLIVVPGIVATAATLTLLFAAFERRIGK